MDARSILTDLRNGVPPDPEQAEWFARALSGDQISDAQAGAFAMGVCALGLPDPARVALTRGMRDSGKTLSWKLDGPVLDKHSTGGVGDCTSLVLAPALAACGAYVPMISGRGLGHTGGTLDKLEAIPGVSTELTEARFREVVATIGTAIVAASADIAPADRRLYAIRDVTGTVRSTDLITASILSKKMAAGLDALVLDVKTGSGAFMQDLASAEALALALVSTANGIGCPTTALITDMNQPLAKSLGNALEVMEVLETLTGDAADPDLGDLAADLGGELLALAGLAETPAEGALLVQDRIANGEAAEVFGRMIAAMGGPLDFVERWPDRLAAAPVVLDVPAPRAGHVSAIDGVALGEIVVGLGGGRRQANDRLDPAVGLSDVVGLGDVVAAGEGLALIHARDAEAGQAAIGAVQRAISLSDAPTEPPALIYRRIP